MTISHTEIWKFSIPMEPFTISTGTMEYAQNIFIRLHTNEGLYGVGECSAFPMIVGETQNTCFEVAKDFARMWKGKPVEDISARIQELTTYIAGNSTVKSAFDMALYDLNAKIKNQPLYAMLGGTNRQLETDITIGIDTAEKMAEKAVEIIKNGAGMLKIKVGKDAREDVNRIKLIRAAIGPSIILRIDANQGWSFEDAVYALNEMEPFSIQYCEQPMRIWNDHRLEELRNMVKIPLMADESVFFAYDAERIIRQNGCDYVNIKFSKSGGFSESIKINKVCEQAGIHCMIGGMLESRIALSAFSHFALASDNVKFHDLDTCLVGHKADPVINGIRYNQLNITVPELPGIGADADDDFLNNCEKISV
jgi:o-succinylbenzoate synthase